VAGAVVPPETERDGESTTDSTIVFHSPHSGQCPIQPDCVAPLCL
jgi:hypothetical protein